MILALVGIDISAGSGDLGDDKEADQHLTSYGSPHTTIYIASTTRLHSVIEASLHSRVKYCVEMRQLLTMVM